MGRGLGIFPGRPKTPFVPGGAQKPLYMSLLPPPSSNTWAQFLICSAAVPERRRRPPPSPSAARAPPPPRPGRLGRRPRQAAHRCAAVLPPCHLVFAAPASTPRVPSSSPPPAASTARRRTVTLSAARHRAASLSKAAALAFPALCECGRHHFIFSFKILCLCNSVLY